MEDSVICKALHHATYDTLRRPPLGFKACSGDTWKIMLLCFNVLKSMLANMVLADYLKFLLEIVESRLYIGTALLEVMMLQWNN